MPIVYIRTKPLEVYLENTYIYVPNTERVKETGPRGPNLKTGPKIKNPVQQFFGPWVDHSSLKR